MKKILFTFLMLAYCSIVFGGDFKVFIQDCQNGTVTASPSENLSQGDNVTLTVTPATGYALSSIKAYQYTDLNNAQGRTRQEELQVGEELELTTVTENESYTFSMPNDNALIVATFAELEPYVILSNDDKTMTFKYGIKPDDAMFFALSDWGADYNKSNVTEVNFDPSFADIEHTSLAQWFNGFTALETANLVNLNTSQVTDFSRMFYNCSELKTLIIDGTFTVTSTASIENMFYNVDHATTLIVQGSTSPSIEQDIFSYQAGSGTFYVFNSARLETQNKFELSGIGWNEDFNLIEYKGGLFDTYNDYHRVEYTGWGFQVEYSPKYAVSGATITMTCQTPGFAPKVTYFINQDESVRLKVTETEDGWTFVMPDAHATISNARFQAILQLSQDQKTLTISGLDEEDAWESGYPNITEYAQAQQIIDNASLPENQENQQAQMQVSTLEADLITFISNCKQNVETVVIENTVSKVTRIDVSYLFNGFSKLTAITGLDNINMQRCFSTQKMFAGCSSLASLTIGSNFIIGSSDDDFTITDMFAGCTTLANGTLTVTSMPTINQNIFGSVFTEGTLLTNPDDLLGDAVTEETDYFLWKGGHFKKFNDQEKVNAETISFTEGLEWSTYCTDKDLLLPDKPDGIEAYYVSAVNITGQTGTITIESKGKKIYQNMPMLIHRTSQSALQLTELAATITSHEDAAPTPAPQYVGTVLGQELAAANNTIFVLRDGKFIAAPAVGNMAAHRCWIDLTITNQQNQQNQQEQQNEQNPVQSGARSLSISYGDGTTGINNHGITEFGEQGAKESWFSLDGRKMDSKPTGKGLYISNGKKVLVK